MLRLSKSRFVCCGIVFVTVFGFFAAFARATEVSNVIISGLTESSATVSWETDVDANAMLNYGLDEAFGVVRDGGFTKKHLLNIQNLDPGTTYHFRVVSADTTGNTAATAGFVFTTKGDYIQKIVKEIQKITKPKDLEIIKEEVQEQISNEVEPPAIVGAPKVIPREDGALVTWVTDRESDSFVNLAPEGEYNENDPEPYTITQGNPKDMVTKHTVDVIGLDPSTIYHFSVQSTDELGLTGNSVDDTFQTKSQLPTVNNLRVSRIQEDSAVVSWSTPVPAKGIVSYTNLRTRATKSAGNPVFATSQSIQLTGLEFGTRYTAYITATNKAGDNYESKPISFITVRDIIPPVIAKVNNESTLFPSEDAKVQTILTWNTDEPANCQVFYTQGLVRSDENPGDTLPAEKNPVTDHTQVVVGFTPGAVYKFWMKCADESGNEAQSDDYVLITPIKEKNIIDLILENFQGTFGWVNKIGK